MAQSDCRSGRLYTFSRDTWTHWTTWRRSSASRHQQIISRPARDNPSQHQCLIGFQDQDNLGLRYLMSSVNASGHEAFIMTYRSDPNKILQRILQDEPDVVGFSLIFQYMAPDFGQVIEALREAGVTAHFTMGGHYASFEPTEILRRIPGLDSIVRFDGEMTLVNLLNCLSNGSDWRSLPGIAFRKDDGEISVAPLAQVVEDLDMLPWPDRHSIDYEGHPMPTASILGSRGCPWDCSFCSIRPFYEEQGGPLRRLRAPREIVNEMLDLHRNRGVPIFLFQDDDFLAGGRKARSHCRTGSVLRLDGKHLLRKKLHEPGTLSHSSRSALRGKPQVAHSEPGHRGSEELSSVLDRCM
jgi:radical SAM superfamily enzyme YgiQ (UPF0313 family)